MRKEQIYSSDFLLNHICLAAEKLDRNDYAKFQVDSVNQLARDFKSDFLTVNILHLNEKLLLDGKITSAIAYASKNTIENYQKILIEDSFTPVTFLNPGTAIFNNSLKAMDEWIDLPIYKEHCTPFDHYWVIGISYQFPHHKTTFVAFDYMRAKGKPYNKLLSEEYIEYISYPFYLGWLRIYGAICSETLREWLSLCIGITQPRFFVLRAIAGQGETRAVKLAEALGVQPKAIYRHVENTFESILSLRPEQYEYDGNADRISSILRSYRFLQFGSGALSRGLPRR